MRRDPDGSGFMIAELCEDFGRKHTYAVRLLGDRLLASTGRACPGPERLYESIELALREFGVLTSGAAVAWRSRSRYR